MPPVEGSACLLDYFFDVGPVVGTGMGGVPLRSEHLSAWQTETGTRLQSWEARALRRLSGEYLSESHRAEKLGCEPPWKAHDHKPEPTAVQLSLRALIENK